MAAQTKAVDRQRKDGIIQAYKMLGSETIYKGTPVILKTTGYVFSNDGTTNTLANGDAFCGIAHETVTNSGANGDAYIRVDRKGSFLMDFSDTLTIANTGDLVYVNNNSDDAVVTITSHATNPQCNIGRIVEFVSANKAWVSIDKYIDDVAANGA